MDEYGPWDNNDDSNWNDSRKKYKRRLGLIVVGLVSLSVCALVLMVRSSRAPATSTMTSNITDVVVSDTATPGPPAEGIDIGLMAPDFTLKTLDGESITLSSLRGRTILLNFWATWCPYCRDEMPAFQNVYEERKDDDFMVISITSESGSELDQVAAFRDDYDLAFPILLDEDGAVSNRYYVSALPKTFFITPGGIIQKIIPGGGLTEEMIKQELSVMEP
jgi:peroxiredoxin